MLFDTPELFIASGVCKTKAHCYACRSDAVDDPQSGVEWRAQINAPFKCPPERGSVTLDSLPPVVDLNALAKVRLKKCNVCEADCPLKRLKIQCKVNRLNREQFHCPESKF